jgi:hypothetical protein
MLCCDLKRWVRGLIERTLINQSIHKGKPLRRVMHKTAFFRLDAHDGTWSKLSASFFSIKEALHQLHEMFETGAYHMVTLRSKNTVNNENTWFVVISDDGLEIHGNTFLYHAERTAEDPDYVFFGYTGEYADDDRRMAPAPSGQRYPYTVEQCTLRRNKYGFQ